MRIVLHDYTDAACDVLLRKISTAMSSYSTHLMDELILLEKNTLLQAAELDIGMMESLAGLGRTEGEWKA